MKKSHQNLKPYRTRLRYSSSRESPILNSGHVHIKTGDLHFTENKHLRNLNKN